MFNLVLMVAVGVFALLIIFSSQLGNRLGTRALVKHNYIFDE